MMTFSRMRCANSEQGSALIYILIAIALLAALTVSFMEPSSQQTSAQGSFRTVADIRGQIQTIRSGIQECILLYNQGDSSVADANYNSPFPLRPSSAHFGAVTPGSTAGDLAKDIRCPGNPDASQADHTLIFLAAEGKFMPPPPELFTDWQYYNGDGGVFFWTSTTNTDAFIQSALDKLDAQYSECEMDIIDATGGAVQLDASNDNSCPAGSRCLRIWVMATGTAVHQDAGCP